MYVSTRMVCYGARRYADGSVSRMLRCGARRVLRAASLLALARCRGPLRLLAALAPLPSSHLKQTWCACVYELACVCVCTCMCDRVHDSHLDKEEAFLTSYLLFLLLLLFLFLWAWFANW